MPTPSYSSGTTGRSPTFPKTLKYFLEHVDGLENEQLEENEATLKQLVEVLVSQETCNYIFEFLVEYGYGSEE